MGWGGISEQIIISWSPPNPSLKPTDRGVEVFKILETKVKWWIRKNMSLH